MLFQIKNKQKKELSKKAPFKLLNSKKPINLHT